MEQDMNQSAHPTLCRSGCGFYGSPATDGLCSKCFKESLKRRQSAGCNNAGGNSAAKPDDLISVADPVAIQGKQCEKKDQHLATTSGDGKVSTETVAEDDKKPSSVTDQDCGDKNDALAVSASSSSLSSAESELGRSAKKATRCGKCNKRVGLTGMECRCGGIFCSLHRYSDMHDCSYDYRAAGAEEIRRNNPVIQSKKIQKF